MKKILAMFLAILLLSTSAALADDLGIQAVGGPDAAVPGSVDDMKVGESYKLDGYAVVEVKEFRFVDCFAQFGETGDYGIAQRSSYWGAENNRSTVYCHSQSELAERSWRYNDAGWMDSGTDAEFAWFMVHVTNLQKDEVDYIAASSVKVIYQNEYEFNGWIRQIDYNKYDKVNSDGGVSRYNQEAGTYPMQVVMNPKLATPVAMMYGSTYVFGCTLPTYIVEDEEAPLRIEIQMGENTLTYNIR